MAEPESTSQLLGDVATSVVTVTAITFSLLLNAVQQASSALTHEVVKQDIRRRRNQFYFGFFIGLAVYALVILSTVQPPFKPVFGGAVALILTIRP